MDRFDPIDLKILALLKQDSRLSHKQIGERVHRTGQAVGARINQLIEQGVIQRYTLDIAHSHQQFIQLFLNEPTFSEIEQILTKFEQIDAAYKVMGGACYMLVAHFAPHELHHFIDQISIDCRYSVETVVKRIEL
ncbi:Lrp/AsnC family transcriptional regulator [Acinetobacter guerrae]|uniref:Lrp/AsnC family transcriptional regulator n=1 Tax=Acinetobacter guerrae TaxID=1843371 RepID=UPI00128C1DCB|nr:winged helix-turn-helix transcriptional regulator [Acinetobacter guerrae]MPW45519.1 transcriptional regulator [Acinetobacter guerrae]